MTLTQVAQSCSSNFPTWWPVSTLAAAGLFEARDLRVGSGPAPPRTGGASGAARSEHGALTGSWVSLQISLRVLVSLWGASARGGAQGSAEVVVPGVVITQSVGVPVDVDRIEFGGQAVDSARVSRPEERLWDRRVVGSPMNTGGTR